MKQKPLVSAEEKEQFHMGFRVLKEDQHEFITYPANTSIRVWRSINVGDSYAPHFHSAVEVILTLKGEVLITTAEQEYHVREGEVLIIPGGCIHSLHMGEGCERELLLFEMNGVSEAVMPMDTILLPGIHNVENYMTAIAVTDGLVSDDTIRHVAATFGGVEHRIELVRIKDGVRFYNDSIASSPSRTIAGLRSFKEKVILIAGGYDKHIPYDVLGPEICTHVKKLFLCGATAPQIRAAVEAGREAAQHRKPATMYFGQEQTRDICLDSRDPQVYDPNLYQLRLEAEDGSAGLRMLFFGAHAESLRGDNLALSRDFPGQLCDRVTRRTDDYTMFCPGAIGGLIMTREFVEENAEENMVITAEKLAECALSITPERERRLSPTMTVARAVFTVPMDNPVFLLYRFLWSCVAYPS